MTKRFLSFLGFMGAAVSAQAIEKNPHDFETKTRITYDQSQNYR